MKQIPKREGAVLNGYGVSVIALVLILFALPFASNFIISLGENLGVKDEASLFESVYYDPNHYDQLPDSIRWISSGSDEDSAIDEGIKTNNPAYPHEIGFNHTPPDRPDTGSKIYPSSKELGSGYSYFSGCATEFNSSVNCGSDDFKMRVIDPNMDYEGKIFNEISFELAGNPSSQICDLISGNVSLKYRISLEIWTTQRALPIPSLPEYWERTHNYPDVFTGKHEFGSCIDSNLFVSRPYFSINHTLDFTESTEYLQIIDEYNQNELDFAGIQKNKTIGFVFEWYDVRDIDRNVPISNSPLKLPYNELNSAISMQGDIDLTYYEADYWNTATNTLTIGLGIIFTIAGLASTPYWNPLKSRIIDRLRDA